MNVCLAQGPRSVLQSTYTVRTTNLDGTGAQCAFTKGIRTSAGLHLDVIRCSHLLQRGGAMHHSASRSVDRTVTAGAVGPTGQVNDRDNIKV